MSVLAAVERDIAEIAARDQRLAASALAAAALELGRQLDDEHNSATSKSMCARALAELMDRLNELAPAREAGDALDDLSARRMTRKAKGA